MSTAIISLVLNIMSVGVGTIIAKHYAKGLLQFLIGNLGGLFMIVAVATQVAGPWLYGAFLVLMSGYVWGLVSSFKLIFRASTRNNEFLGGNEGTVQ